MTDPKILLLAALIVVTITYIVVWAGIVRKRHDRVERPGAREGFIGFITDFFDTLGIGSFAPTTAMFKAWKVVPDEKIPGTLNVGHTLPTVAQALIYIVIVEVEFMTLALLIVTAVLGAWLGAGVVSRWSRRRIQVGMGFALLVAAVIFAMTNLNLIPGGGTALALEGPRLLIGLVGNFMLGALMTLGVGLYAPCLIMIGLLGMNPKAAFPIMMGSCAFLMPMASVRFIKAGAYDLKAALGLAIAGVPAVLLAAFIVKSLNVTAVRWLVTVVVLYTAITMLLAARREKALNMKPGLAADTLPQA
jgi:uncharacterized membrane protein YfcA